jgi:GntR family transcriptional regulator, rspAB operon transcriptional repressor
VAKASARRKRSWQTASTTLRTRRSSLDGTHNSLGEKVYQAFKRDIISGEFLPGAALSEKALAHRYKGSRTPVREAAVRLQQERLLRIVPNRGYFVSPITLRELNEVYEYRSAVECAAAELAARKGADPELLKKLTLLATTPYRGHDRKSCIAFIQADTAFHIGIARLSRNQMLERAVSEARCLMERIMYAAIDISYYGEFPTREHLQILEAIGNHNPQLAHKCMFEHIIQSKDKVLSLAGSNPRQF